MSLIDRHLLSLALDEWIARMNEDPDAVDIGANPQGREFR